MEKSCSEEGSGGEEEEDSDLASIARELQVIFKPASGITQHAEWILNKIENTFNGTFTR